MLRHWTLTVALMAPLVVRAEATKVLCDFDTPTAVRQWDYVSGTPRLVAEGVTQGQRALEIRFDPKARYYGAYVYWRRPRRDWSAYDALVLDVFNPSDGPVAAYILVADQAWKDKNGSYWNRHNGGRSLPPGHTEWIIPVRGLYRGEAGSRNNDIKRNIDPDKIVRVDFGFGKRGTTGRIILDNLRLVKAAKPEGVWAFDFGPPSQSLMLGWTRRRATAGGPAAAPPGTGPHATPRSAPCSSRTLSSPATTTSRWTCPRAATR